MRSSRRIGRFVSAALWAVLLPSAALAQSAPSATPDITVKGERPEDQKICKTEVQTGSIMPRRVCRTVAQIAEQREKHLQTLGSVQQVEETNRYVALLCQTFGDCYRR